MKRIYVFLILSLCSCFGVNAQTADLRFGNPVVNCTTNKLEVAIQMKAQTGTFKIGTSSILVNYNPAALGFASYQSENFDKNDLCIANTATSWDDHAFDGSTDGVFNLTVTLLNNDFSCPEITTGWLDVGKIMFNIESLALNPNLSFDVPNTNFNSVPANDGTNPILKGVFTGFNPAALSCPNACGVNAGANRSTCAKDTIRLASAPVGQTWSFLDGPATASIDQTGSVAQMTAAGIYRFVLQDATCKDTVLVTRAAMQVNNQSRSFCQGGSSTLSASGFDAGTTFAWLPGGQTSSSLTVTTAGTYTLTATSPTGCMQQFVWTITVNPNPTPNVTGSLLICPGGSTTLTASGGSTFEWKNAAGTVISPTASSGTITQPGIYSVLISIGTCQATVNATVSQATKPSAGRDTTICAPNTTVQLATIVSGASWSSVATNPAGVSIGSTSGLVSGLATNGIFNFIITNNTSGCADTVQVVRADKPSAGLDLKICGVNTAKLPAAAAGQTWKSITPPNPAGVAIDAAGNVSGLNTFQNFFFELSSGICKDTVTISRLPLPNAGRDTTLCSPATSIQLLQVISGASWSANAGNPSAATIGATSGLATGLLTNGTYRFTLTTTGGCTDEIIVQKQDRPNAGPDIRVCGGTTAKLPDATAIGGTWQARATNPVGASITQEGNVSGMNAAGTYRFYLVTGTCSDTVNVIKSIKPEVGGDTTLCSPATTIQLATVLSGATWSVGSGAATIGATSGLASGLTTNGLYQFIFTNTSSGCSDTVKVTRTDKPNAGTDIKICGTATSSQLSGSPAGGTWSGLSSNPAGASVNSTGLVTNLGTGTYRFVYQTGTCTDTVKIEKFTKPNAGVDFEVCAPVTTASLGAVTGAGAWSAVAGNTATIGTTSGAISGMNANASYGFVFTNTSTGCSDTVVVVRKDCGCVKPNITTSNPAEVCGSATVNLANFVSGCTGNLIFYSDLGGLNPITGSTITTSTTSTYYAKCTVAGCDSDLKPVLITIKNKSITPVITSDKVSLCPGESATLNATNCAGTVTWFNGATQLGESATQTVTMAGTYTARCTEAGKCESDLSAGFVMNAGSTPTAPTITGGGSICSGETLTLSFGTACKTGEIIRWSTGATTPTITITSTGTYSAVCQNSCGDSPVSNSITITAGGAPNAPTILGGGSICAGKSVTLSASCQGAATLLWNSGATTSSINVTTAGTYTAKCVNACGESQASEPKIVTLEQLPSAPMVSGGGLICGNVPIVLTASPCQVGESVKWNTGATTASISVLTAGSYSATCSNNCGESNASNVVSISKGNLPSKPTVIGGGNYCNGDEIVLKATGCGASNTIIWYQGTSLAKTALASDSLLTVSTSGSYYAICKSSCGESDNSEFATVFINFKSSSPTISGANELCNNQSITLSSTPCPADNVITWSKDGSVIPAQTTTNLVVNLPGVYSANCVNICFKSEKSNEISVKTCSDCGPVFCVPIRIVKKVN